MKIFVDSADITVISQLTAAGLVDGVTTNPSLIARAGKPMRQVIEQLCAVNHGPISAEVLATECEAMWTEAQHLAKIAANVVVKIPLTVDGLRVVRRCAESGIATNVTLCFSVPQALMAAKAGASYVSPFIGRIDDLAYEGMTLIRQIRTVYRNFSLPTAILSASVRTLGHVRDAALAGSDAVTIPPELIGKMLEHPLTTQGLEKFMADAAKIPPEC